MHDVEEARGAAEIEKPLEKWLAMAPVSPPRTCHT